MTSDADRPRTRRFRLAGSAVSLLLGGIVASQLVLSSDAAPQKTTASSCSMTVPARISINTPYMTPAATLSSDCTAAGVFEAKWAAKYDVLSGDGALMNELYFNRTRPSEWWLFDAARLGVWTWTPGGAQGSGDVAATTAGKSTTPASQTAGTAQVAADIPQNAPTTDIRLAATGQLASWTFEAGCWTTFTAVATRYAAKCNGHVSLAGARGRLEARPPDRSWITNAGSFTTDAAGKATIRIPNSGADLEFRVWIDDQYALTWAASSAWKPVNDPC